MMTDMGTSYVASDTADWGASDWAEDADAARAQALSWVAQVAEEKGWTDDEIEDAESLIEQSYNDNASWYWFDDVGAFWYELAQSFDDEGDNTPSGWSNLSDMFWSAYETTTGLEANRELGDVSTMLYDAAVGTASDVQDMTNPKKSWVPWAVGSGLILGAMWVTR